ncbi:unnamed protein product [Meloidogyne enterolobii]|uniref:Uncharacterized protein n=1 Tax=Meloidogyne enterolobii TaxID=390850 RepID=A0ACB0ZM35_MELEN
MVELLAMQSTILGEQQQINKKGGENLLTEELALDVFGEEEEGESAANGLSTQISEREQREIGGEPGGGQTLKKVIIFVTRKPLNFFLSPVFFAQFLWGINISTHTWDGGLFEFWHLNVQ